MSCDWSAKLDRYLDSELPASDLAEVQAHLLTCPSCAAGALSRLQLKRLNQAVGRQYRASPEFRLKIERSITPGKRWISKWIPVIACAAVLALVVTGAAGWQEYSLGEQAAGELADLHVSALASPNPVDVVSTDRHTVKPWFQGKIPFTFNLPELQNSPFKLVGGRLTYFQQSPGAQLLFEFRKHRISVFIFQDRREVGRLFSTSSLTKQTFASESWSEGGLRYFLVGDCSPSDIHDLGQLLKSAAKS
jgi:anti-sigma factor RsiW